MTRLISGLWVLLLSGVAVAQDDAQNILDSVFTAQHKCNELMPGLDAAVAANPDGIKPLVDRASCYYRVGRYEWVRRDLRLAMGSRSIGAAIDAAKADGLSDADARAAVELGAVLQVVMAVEDKNVGQAQGIYSSARQVFGDSPAMARANIAVVAGGGDTKRAWGLVDTALDRWPEEGHIRMAAAEMASRDYRNITEKANAVLNAPANAVGWYNEAVAAYNRNDFPVCLSNVDAALGSVSAEERLRFINLGYSCAVASGSVSDSNRFIRETGSVAGLRSDVVIRHAMLLHKADRNPAALALLESVTPANASERAEADTLMVRAYTAEGNLDGALAVGLRAQAEPNSVANLALKLKEAGRLDDARAVLVPTCPRMVGQDAVRCADLQKRLSKN